jgi:hypothetical protein
MAVPRESILVSTGKEEMDKPHSTENKSNVINPLLPVMDVLGGEDPEVICKRYNISPEELNRRLDGYQKSLRQMAVSEEFSVNRVGRNEPCPCGSGKKYKKCCLSQYDEARQHIPANELHRLEERVKRREAVEKDITRGFELLISKDFEKAMKLASTLLETCPEDDRIHDIQVNACMATGDYEKAFKICRRRWQVAVEESEHHRAKGSYKRAGEDGQELVHFYSPSSWLEKFWMAQRARSYAAELPRGDDVEMEKLVGKLDIANDLKRFPERQEKGFELRRKALEPVLAELGAAGTMAIPYLLPLTFNFSWATLFVPDLLAGYGTDDCIRLLAELSMFRLPLFSRKCLENLESMGPRVIPHVEGVLQRDSAFDELKIGLISLLGHFSGPESLAVLTRWADHDNLIIVHWVANAMERHGDPEARPYLEKARARLEVAEEKSEIAGAIQALAGEQGKSP